MDGCDQAGATGLVMQAETAMSQDAFETKTITPLRILFCDDDDTIREAMVAILAWFGHDTRSAALGEEAVDMYRSNTVDLIITDNFMPDMKGHELAQKIRAINPDAKIILLTGANNGNDESHSAFVNFTLRKPVTMQTVLDTIQNLFPKSL
jgi:CheY-like chemotaxis protein